MSATTVAEGHLRGADPDRARAADYVIAQIPMPETAATIDVHNPADGLRLAAVPQSSAEEAVSAALEASEIGRAWAARTLRSRADVLHAWYDMLIQHAEDLALVITREMGKPLGEARAEVAYGSDFVRWYAEEAVRPSGSFRDVPSGGGTVLVRRAPVGLAVLITPWNFPLAMATRKIAPALAAGCPVLIKPSELTPLTTYLAVELAQRAGVPAGLIQVVSTEDPSAFSEAVLQRPEVRKLSFTGSTGVGTTLLRLASDRVLRTSMELGGNAPFIVFDDADLDRAVEGAYAAKMRNGGQSCIAANRIYVQNGIAEAFIEGLSEKMSSTVVGDGLGDGVGLGPVINDTAARRLRALVDNATAAGADLLVGGTDAIDRPGHFVRATVLDHVPADAAVAVGEVFGPIAAVQRFSTQQEVLSRANDVPVGLAGYVFTQDVDRALNVADALETGLVGINQGVPSNAAAPFGGVKQSGIGREGSSEGLEEYQEIRMYNLARRQTP